MKSDIQTKRSQFVGSPKRIKEGLEAVTRAVEAARVEAAHQEDNRHALMRRIEVVAKGEKDVAKAMLLLSELEVRPHTAGRCEQATRWPWQRYPATGAPTAANGPPPLPPPVWRRWK